MSMVSMVSKHRIESEEYGSKRRRVRSFMRCQERPSQRRQSRPGKLRQGFLHPPSQVGPGPLENVTSFELAEQSMNDRACRGW